MASNTKKKSKRSLFDIILDPTGRRPKRKVSAADKKIAAAKAARRKKK